MSKDCDIVILSLIKWDGPVSSSPYALAKEFARNNRVFYINHPYSIKDVVKLEKNRNWINKFSIFSNSYQQPQSGLPKLHTVTPCLTIPINFLPEGLFYETLSQINDALVFALIRRLIADFRIKKFVFINAFDSFYARRFPLNILQPIKKIYHSLDDISEVKYTALHGIRLEREMAVNYDLVLTSSAVLKSKLSAYASEIYMLPNGADTSLFNKAQIMDYPCPEELVPYQDRPIIGYTGSLEYRTDLELLNAIADGNPDKLICIVGPVYSEEAVNSGFFERLNVLYCGSKQLEQLPAYLKYMSCMIIPFKCNKLTSSIYPLKINEYLAAGKPVVSTGFSAEILSFSDIISIATDAISFNILIDLAIESDSPELVSLRMTRASKNSWQTRVSEFWKILGEDKTEEVIDSYTRIT